MLNITHIDVNCVYNKGSNLFLTYTNEIARFRLYLNFNKTFEISYGYMAKLLSTAFNYEFEEVSITQMAVTVPRTNIFSKVIVDLNFKNSDILNDRDKTRNFKFEGLDFVLHKLFTKVSKV